jgi:hypothetical protein
MHRLQVVAFNIINADGVRVLSVRDSLVAVAIFDFQRIV